MFTLGSVPATALLAMYPRRQGDHMARKVKAREARACWRSGSREARLRGRSPRRGRARKPSRELPASMGSAGRGRKRWTTPMPTRCFPREGPRLRRLSRFGPRAREREDATLERLYAKYRDTPLEKGESFTSCDRYHELTVRKRVVDRIGHKAGRIMEADWASRRWGPSTRSRSRRRRSACSWPACPSAARPASSRRRT